MLVLLMMVLRFVLNAEIDLWCIITDVDRVYLVDGASVANVGCN